MIVHGSIVFGALYSTKSELWIFPRLAFFLMSPRRTASGVSFAGQRICFIKSTPKALSGFWGVVHGADQSAGEAVGRVEKNSMKRPYQSGVTQWPFSGMIM